MSLQLPPALEEPPSRERALEGPVELLLPQATERLRRRLCSVGDLRLGRVVGRGEKIEGTPAACMHDPDGGVTANTGISYVYCCL